MGQPPGIAPLGYLNTKLSTKGTNKVIPDPDRWHIVRKAFDLLLSGTYTAPQIVTVLNNEHGLRSRPGNVKGNRPICKSTIYRVFTNPFYYGYFDRKGVLYKGTYQSMITVEEFDQVQEILGRKGKPRPKKHVFAFTGLMTCGECGCAVTATEKTKRIKQTGELKTYVFYHCTKRKKDCACTQKHYTTGNALEAMVVAELYQSRLRPAFKEWALAVLEQNHQREIDRQNALVKATVQQENKLLQELDNLIELRISDGISEEKYLEKKAEKDQLLIRVQAKRMRMENQENGWARKLKNDLEFLVCAVDRFKNGDIQVQKEICQHFGWNWQLKAQKLLIYKHEWFEPIIKYRKAVERVFGRLEPEKTFAELGDKAAFELLRPIVRRLVHEVRTQKPKKE